MRSWLTLGLIFVAMIGAVIVVLSFHPIYVNQCYGYNESGNEYCRPNNILYVAFVEALAVVRHAEFWTAIATCFIAYFTRTLKRSTDNLIVATNKIADAQALDTRTLQRAYLTGEPQGAAPGLDKRSIGFVGFKNVGHLPATDAHWFLKMEFSADRHYRPDITRIDYEEFFGSNIIVPGAEMRQAVYGEISKSQWTSVRDGKGYIYIWGRIFYTDGFGKLRRTDICHRYNFRGYTIINGKPALHPDGMRYHESGNDAD